MPEISDTTDNPNREQVSQHSLVSLSQDRISTQERLSSAASVLTGGIADGTLEQAGVALRDPNTLLKLGGSALIGAALTIGNGRRGLVRLASHGATLSLGLMFANDVYHRGSITAAAVADTWNSPNRAGQNRALVADTMGPLVVDTAIYGIGGMTGAGIAHRSALGRVPSFDPAVVAELRGRTAGGSAQTAQLAVEPVLTESMLVRPTTVEPQLSAAREVRAVVEQASPGLSPGVEPQVIEVHVLRLGERFQTNKSVQLDADSNLGNLVARTREGIAKVEVFKLENGELAGGESTAVSVTADGRLVTTRHLIDDAISITVFDATGRPHSARVAGVNPDRQVDLAMLQLVDPRSFSAFRPLELRAETMEAVPAGTPIAVLGHPNGYNRLFVSPGGAGNRFGINSTFSANVHEGSCGSAIVDMDGRLLAMMKNKGASVNGTSDSFIRGLLGQTESVSASAVPGSVPGRAPLRQNFEVADADRSMQVIETIFGARLRSETPPDLFHSRARRATVPQTEGSAEMLLRTSFDPLTNEVSVRPMTLAGRSIAEQTTWHGTDIPISSAELRLRFTDGFSRAEMTSVNDPLNILPRGLELRGGAPSYLSTLRGTPVIEAPVMTVEPPVAVTGSPASRAASSLPSPDGRPGGVPNDTPVASPAPIPRGLTTPPRSLARPLFSGAAPIGLRRLTDLTR